MTKAWTLIKVQVDGGPAQRIKHIYSLVPKSERDAPPPPAGFAEILFETLPGKEAEVEALEVVKDHTDGKPRVWRVPSTGDLLTEIR